MTSSSLPAADGNFVLTCKPDPDPQRNPALYDPTPVDELRVKGPYIRDHQRKEGIGAPLVAIERGVNDLSQRDDMIPKILKDSPATWVPMFNHLIAHDRIRHTYQLWPYAYPTGYPYPYSAAILRRELDAIERRFPRLKKMVVVGHSMGGCIGRLLMTDTGDKLWREIFKTAPSETALSAESRALLTEVLTFHHRPEIGRTIFIAAPLRGSDLAATGWDAPAPHS